MKSWRLLPLLVALVPMMGAAYVSCSYNTPPTTPTTPMLSFATELDLRNVDGESRRTFAAGELIHMVLTVRNRLSQSAQVDFVTSRTYDFIVVPENTNIVIWQWSNAYAETPRPTTVAFGGGETKTFEAVWNQLDNSGQPVPSGNYEARGVLVYDGFDANPMQSNQLASAPVNFMIE